MVDQSEHNLQQQQQQDIGPQTREEVWIWAQKHA